jgi:competence protein ComEC
MSASEESRPPTPTPSRAAGPSAGPEADAPARPLRLDPRAPAIAAAVWLGTATGLSGRTEAVVVVVLAACLAGVVLARRWRRLLLLAVALAAAAALLATAGRSVAQQSGPLPALAAERAVVHLQVAVGPGSLSTGGRFGDFWQATARVEQFQARGESWLSGEQVRLVASGDVGARWAELAVGTRVAVVARLEVAQTGTSEVAVARAREPPVVVAAPGWSDQLVADLRAGLRQVSTVLPAEPAALLPALVVGDTSAMTPELRERFRLTGLTHLTAVSGSNLTLMLASLLWLARRLRVRGWGLRAVAVSGVVAFVVLCHGEPSVLRAAAMGSVGIAALGLGGRVQGLRYLSWSVVVLLGFDPWLALAPGFALSVLATGGIVVFARRWTQALAAWVPVGLAEAFAVPLAAQLATQPVVTALSGQVSLAGVLANLAAGPLVGPATVLGLLSLVLAPVLPAVASGAAWLAGWPVQGLCWIARLGEALPSPAVPWPAGPAALALLAAGCGLLLLMGGALLARRWVVLGLAALLVVSLLRPLPVPGWPPTGWDVVACDVGQGSASVIDAGPGGAILVDGGPEPRALDRCLTGLGVQRIALLVVTHLHADHIGGLPGLGSRPVAAVLASGVRTPAGGWDQVLAATPGAARLEAVPGQVFEVGVARLEVVSLLLPTAAALVTPDGSESAESSQENDASVVVRVDTGDLVVLATGDVEDSGQWAALRTGRTLAADVLVVPHHGSARQVEQFLLAVAARVALIGVGQDNDYGHPAPTALRLLAAAGSEAHRTDLEGSIAVARSPDGFTVTVERPG